MMKLTIATLLGLTIATPVWADGPSCTQQSTDKHLAGAAQTSFMKKCTTDAQTSCDQQATDKKLNGAARTSFTTKCVKDSVGS